MYKIKLMLVLMTLLLNGVGAQFDYYGSYQPWGMPRSQGQIPNAPGASGMITGAANALNGFLRGLGRQ